MPVEGNCFAQCPERMKICNFSLEISYLQVFPWTPRKQFRQPRRKFLTKSDKIFAQSPRKVKRIFFFQNNSL